MPLQWPGPEDHTAVVGRNGSGKTVGGAWHLSGKDFKDQAWVIYNTKGDELLNAIGKIEGVKQLDVDGTPEENGLYIVNPMPRDKAAVDLQLGRIWERGNCGTYLDEGYWLDEDENLNSLLTQGRSRRCPVIVLSQRPAWLTKYAFSECNFVHLFNLQIQDDRKKIGQIVPVDKDYRLRPYHSYWYNVKEDRLVELSPVPPPEDILSRFRAKFPPNQPPVVSKPVDIEEVFGPTQGRRYL